MSGFSQKDALLVGVNETEITPPVGTPLAGSLEPRISKGIEDPLYVKSIVIESGGKRLAYAVFDLAKLSREDGDRFVALASEKTGIPKQNIVWTTTHTHTGPYTTALFADDNIIDRKWLSALSEKAANCLAKADSEKQPALFSRQRAFHYGIVHNRRITFKNGQAINTWNLNQAPEEVQSVGSSGPTDPEIGILSFDGEDGRLLAVMFHFSLHTNTNFGPRFSGDYPAVVAARINERFGRQVSTLFLPGTFADINSTGARYREVGDNLAEKIIPALEKRKPEQKGLLLGSIKEEITVPRRDFGKGQDERIRKSGWSGEAQEVFRRELKKLRETGEKEDLTVLQAWRIGDIGFATMPGEIFVEWGLKIKRESPFPWTYPVELGGDTLGYLITEKAWNEGGYEPLATRGNRASAEGVGMMVERLLCMLEKLASET